MIQKMIEAGARKGLDQTDIEELVGLPRGKISKWKKKGEPTVSQAVALANALGIDLCYLIDDRMERPPVRVSDLAPDEESVLEQYRTLADRLTKEDAIRALSDAYGAKASKVGRVGKELDPTTGKPVAENDRRRGTA